MQIIDNINHIVKNDLQESIRTGSKLSIAAACFSIYAYQELKKQLESIDELHFIFTSPTFVTEKTPKAQREFYIPRISRERSLYGTEFEVKLRNELTQKAVAKECADWIRRKAIFKSNVTQEQMMGFMTVDESTYMPINGFTSLDYPITVEGETFYPGQSYEKYLDRKNGKHARADWAWRWSKELFDFGYENGFIVIKKYDGYSRIYTKTYQNCKIAKAASGFTIEYIQRTKAISTLEFVENEYSNDNSKKNLTSLFESSVFDYSKPTALLKTLVQYSSTADDIVMDFFSGSATTAHAVMQLNAEDGGHRKFIMVQLPEKCDETSEAYKAGYKNICEIGKERIRRAGDKIKSESPMTTQDLDIGFRVLKLDDTNMKDVYYAPDDYDQGMLAGLESNIKDDRTDLDLLFGCLIDWGLPLSLPYKSEQLGGCTVHTYNDGDLIACFDANIPESVVKEIAKRKPLRAVFRDSGFASSPEKINVFEIFKLYMPEDANDISKRVRVI